MEAKNSGFKLRILLKISEITRKYQFQGIDRLLRLIYNPDKRYNDFFDIVYPYDTNMLININSASYVEWIIFFYGYYEPEVINLIKCLLKPGSYAVDVGANCGSHTLIMSKLVGREGKVIAIEPHPKIFQRLLSNLELNSITNVETLQIALSDFSGTAILHSFDEQDPVQGKSSLVPLKSDEALSLKIEVTCKTLDQILEEENIKRLDLVKIDVEGLEYNVLRGGYNSIRQFRPYIIFEYNKPNLEKLHQDFASLEELLLKAGYNNLYVIHGKYLSNVEYGLGSSANILAVPKK